MRRVVVVGSGIAGAAAAIVASRGGAEVTLVRGPPGATALAPGALDALGWEDRARERATPLDDDALAVLAALGIYTLRDGRLPREGVVLAVTTGLIRPADGADRALLDLSQLSGTILVPDVDHAGWDARTMARGWTDASWARDRSLSFMVAPASLMRLVDEHAMTEGELAERHDDPARVEWLAGRLADAMKSAPSRPSALLMPSWLGVERAVAGELSSRLGLPCGEAMIGVGSPSGLRFERARDRALEAARVTVLDEHADAAEPEPLGAWRVLLESKDELLGDAIVLATGGLVGGGLRYSPAGATLAAAFPAAARPLATLSVRCPSTLAAFGRPLDVPGSLSGSAPESHAWPYVADSLLDHLGIQTDSDGRVVGAPDGLFVAGDLVADRPRTWLAALSSGARAGAVAARPGGNV